MNNCGLPKGCEDQCCLNRSGMCTLDTADYSDIDRAVGMRGCGFIGVNDRYMLWKYGVPYKGFVCGNCQHYKGDTHGVCTTDRDHGYSNSRYSGAHACGDFKKREGEDMPKQTYYTKCGREFEKSTNAETTGYHISESVKDGTICDIKCVECPFPVEVTEGWGENKKHVRWECRAGSQPPTNLNDWRGSTEDKLTIQVRSLDHAFLESVLEYCEADPELAGSYVSDLSDCRRSISICCSSNKKGIAAKKALVEKFFPIVEAVSEEETEESKVDCKTVLCGFNNSGECSFEINDTKNTAFIEYAENALKRGCKNQELKDALEDFKNKKTKTVNESPKKVTESLEIVTEKADIAIFDYSTVDTDTADFLQDKAEKIATIRMKSVMAIGKELKEAQDKLANNKNGVFGAWCESIGIKKDTAYRHINAYEYIVANCEDITAADQIQPSLLFAVSKPSAPKELQEQVLSGDVKTLKEYKELEDKLKAVTYEKKMYMEQAKEAENRANAKERALAGFKEDINNYQQEIGHLNQQLNSKPLEVQATTIKEVVPAEVQAELQRLTTENRLLSEKQTSTSYTITTIIDNAASSTAEVDAFVQYAKHEIPNLPEIPVSLKDAVYKSLTFLKMAVLDLENVTKQFKE